MRQGVPTTINPYDLFALEEALRLRDRYGGNVTVLTMGPANGKTGAGESSGIRRRPGSAPKRPALRRVGDLGNFVCYLASSVSTYQAQAATPRRKLDKTVALATTSEVHPPEIHQPITAQSAWHDEC